MANTSETLEEFSIEDTETVIKSAVGSVLTDCQYTPYVLSFVLSLSFNLLLISYSLFSNSNHLSFTTDIHTTAARSMTGVTGKYANIRRIFCPVIVLFLPF